MTLMNYDEFKEKIIKAFHDIKWHYLSFTDKEKEEFINKGNPDFHNYYENDYMKLEDASIKEQELLISRIALNLFDECDSYFNDTPIKNFSDNEVEKVDESKYPMSFKEFMKTYKRLLIEDAVNDRGVSEDTAKKDIDSLFKDGTDDGYNTYKKHCDAYDDYKSKGWDPELVFKEPAISSSVDFFNTSFYGL